MSGHAVTCVALFSVLCVGGMIACSKSGNDAGDNLNEAEKEAAPPPRAIYRMNSVDTKPVPDWSIQNLKVDTSCASLLNFCVSVSCDVLSADEQSRSGTAFMTVRQDGKSLKQNRALTLNKGQRHTVSHEFKEARLFGDDPVGACAIEYQGTRIECAVENYGTGDGAVGVDMRVILKDGSERKHTIEDLSLSVGEKKIAKHVFEGLEPSSVIRAECDWTDTMKRSVDPMP